MARRSLCFIQTLAPKLLFPYFNSKGLPTSRIFLTILLIFLRIAYILVLYPDIAERFRRSLCFIQIFHRSFLIVLLIFLRIMYIRNRLGVLRPRRNRLGVLRPRRNRLVRVLRPHEGGCFHGTSIFCHGYPRCQVAH